jgi:pyruvate dehydrogenase E2 component (dihydrolipoamide acetyltransferase)
MVRTQKRMASDAERRFKAGDKAMDVKVVMPQLGNEIEEAQIDSWLKKPGDSVVAGEQIVVITTPKLTMEIEAPASGVLREITVGADELAPVGATLGIIEQA